MGLEKLIANEESFADYTSEQIQALSVEILDLPKEDQKNTTKQIIRTNYDIGKDRTEGTNAKLLELISIPEIAIIVQEIKKEAIS